MAAVYAATVITPGPSDDAMAKLVAALQDPTNRAEAVARVAALDGIRHLQDRDYAAAKERDILKNALAAPPPTPSP